jgi:DNA-binding transcriptional MocR family regulator
MSPGPTFDRVYQALKEQLRRGRFAPGDHLEPSALGEELNASITPVRDALHRLVGERIVEVPRNDGFRVPAPLEAELRDLYGWNGRLVDLAIRSRGFRSGEAASPHSADEAPADAADLFHRIAHLTGNPEHEAAIGNLSERLAALRVAEAEIFGDLDEELGAMRAALDAPNSPELRRLIASYHRRRQRCAPDILAAARKPRRPR